MNARVSPTPSRLTDLSLAQLPRRHFRPSPYRRRHRRISLLRHGVRQPRLGLVHSHQAHLGVDDPVRHAVDPA